jgi:hypothetical protein
MGSQEICDLFAEFIERTYANELWVPSDPGPGVTSVYCFRSIECIRVRLLLEKMSTDVEPSRCQCLGSYFSGRIQRVKMGDCVSKDILVTAGFPQGPFCFTSIVNEISRIFRHMRVLFCADDMKLCLPVLA